MIPVPDLRVLILLVFLPMAMDSKVLQKSLIAWSSAHLSAYSKSHFLTALENRSAALLLVHDALSAPILSPAESETILAACLVLCSCEVAFGGISAWDQHLLGARQIILTAHRLGANGEMITGTDALMKSKDGQWLLRNFAYHDVLGAVTTLDPPLILGPYWLPKEDGPVIVDSYVGLGSKVLAMLSEICALDINPRTYSSPDVDWDNNLSPDESAPTLDFWQIATDIETRLQQWTCPDGSDIPIVELAESYRSASLIVLYRKMRLNLQRHSPNSPMLETVTAKIEAAVDDTMFHIGLIPMQALPECGLLFPLFMAGGDTLKPTQIEVVRARLTALKEHRGFGNLGSATEVLEELWRCRASGYKGESGDLDWLDVLARKGWLLTLC
jgi:transcriptional activator protein UGA3